MPAPFADTPCNRFFGFHLRHRSEQRVELELPVRAEFLQEEGVECKMNFLGPATSGTEPLRAVATPLRLGRTIAVCESIVLQGERTVAKGTFTFLLRQRDR